MLALIWPDGTKALPQYWFIISEVFHYNDIIMGAIASQITSLTIVFSAVYLDTDKRKQQSSASLAFVRGIHRRPVNSPHKWPVTRKMFPFDDVIMCGIHTRAILQRVHKPFFRILSLKCILSKSLPHPPMGQWVKVIRHSYTMAAF